MVVSRIQKEARQPVGARVTASELEDFMIQDRLRVLQSLIPEMAQQENPSELDIINACLRHIDSLKDQVLLSDKGVHGRNGKKKHAKRSQKPKGPHQG